MNEYHFDKKIILVSLLLEQEKLEPYFGNVFARISLGRGRHKWWMAL